MSFPGPIRVSPGLVPGEGWSTGSRRKAGSLATRRDAGVVECGRSRRRGARRERGEGSMRIVDLSALITPSPPDAPPFYRTGVAYSDHAAGAGQIRALMQVPSALLRDGEGW